MAEYNLYAVVGGKKLDIEDLRYTVTRETEPIYQMGTPIHREHKRRTLVGNLTLSREVLNQVHDRRFDIYIEDMKENRRIILHRLWITSYSHSVFDECFAAFIADSIDVDELKKLEEMTNRELAKRLLTKEY
jgi:hypothetical protein